MAVLNRPILSLADLLATTQRDFGVLPMVDPTFSQFADEVPPTSPFRTNPFANNFLAIQDSTDGGLSRLPDLDPDLGEPADVPDLEATFGNVLGTLGDLAGVTSSPSAFGRGLDTIGRNNINPRQLTALGRALFNIGDRIDFANAINPQDPFSPFDQAPIDALFDPQDPFGLGFGATPEDIGFSDLDELDAIDPENFDFEQSFEGDAPDEGGFDEDVDNEGPDTAGNDSGL